MKRIAVALALCLPLAALAAPQGPGPGPGRGPRGEGWEARKAQMIKRMRVAFTVGYAEALDLSEADALKVRDTLSKFDARRATLHKEMHEQVMVVRKAAEGDAAAGKALDGAIARLHELRGKMVAMRDEMFQDLTRGLSPEKKAKAALFLNRFRARMMMGGMHMRERIIEMRRGMPCPKGECGPGMMRGPGGPGGMGMGGGRMGMEHMGFRSGGDLDDGPGIAMFSEDDNL